MARITRLDDLADAEGFLVAVRGHPH